MKPEKLTFEEVSELVNEALRKHAPVDELYPSPSQEIMPIKLDTDVVLLNYEFWVSAGIYALKTSELERMKLDAPIYHIAIVWPFEGEDPNEAGKRLKHLYEAGEETTEELQDGTSYTLSDGETQIEAIITPITVGKDNDPLPISEIGVWIAFSELVGQGKGDKAIALIQTMYGYEVVDERAESKQELDELFSQPLKQSAHRLRKHTVQVTKVAQEITTIKPNVRKSISVGSTRKPATVYVSLECDTKGVSIERHVSEYDLSVHDAWASLVSEGATLVTDRQIFQAMTGTESKITQKQIQDVANAMQKCFDTPVTIDFSDEVKGRGLEVDGKQITAEKAIRRGRLINYDVVTVKGKNGEMVRAYKANGEPMLTWYARITGKLVTVNQRVYTETSGAVSLTAKNIGMRGYLIRRIESMKRSGKLTRKIKYATMQDRVSGGAALSRTQKSRLNADMLNMLNAFVEAGYIAGAHEYTETVNSRVRPVGIEITLNEEDEPKKTRPRKSH